MTWDGSTILVYKNGVQVGSLSGSSGTTGMSGAIGNNTSLNRGYDGSIGSFFVYNRVLTVAEVNQNFRAERQIYGI